MQPISTLVTVLCGLALPVGSAHAARIVYSCNVVQNLSGVSHPETVALDDAHKSSAISSTLGRKGDILSSRTA